MCFCVFLCECVCEWESGRVKVCGPVCVCERFVGCTRSTAACLYSSCNLGVYPKLMVNYGASSALSGV